MLKLILLNILGAASLLVISGRVEAKFCVTPSDCTVGEICGPVNSSGMRQCMGVGMPTVPTNVSSCPAGKVLETNVCPLLVSKAAPICQKNVGLGPIASDWSVKECDCSWTYRLFAAMYKNCTSPLAGSQAASSPGKCSNDKKGAILQATRSSGYFKTKSECESPSSSGATLCLSMCNMAGMADRGLPARRCCSR